MNRDQDDLKTKSILEERTGLRLSVKYPEIASLKLTKGFMHLLFLLLTPTLFAQTATTPSGTGTSGDPYQIATLDNLYWLTQTTSVWDDNAYFQQTADIDASSSSTWDSGEGFSPIGNKTTAFIGNYNGKGYVIDGLFMDREGVANDRAGLFGNVNNTVIDSVGVTNISYEVRFEIGGIVGRTNGNTSISNSFTKGKITGGGDIGGIVGYLDGNSSVSNCYAIIHIQGSGGDLGGLVGFIDDNQTVMNSYAIGSVAGGDHLGGAVGHLDKGGTVTNVYSAVMVYGDGDDEGIFLGENDKGIVSNGNWYNGFNDDLSDIGDDDNGQSAQGLGAYEMRDSSSFSGFDFVNTWAIDQNTSFPYLRSVVPDTLPGLNIPIPVQPNGSGTEVDPYQMSNFDNYHWLMVSDTAWGNHYQQTADIDFSEALNSWPSEFGFIPIGRESKNFTGVYNGGHYSLSNFLIDRSFEDGDENLGFFGVVQNATIENVHLIDVSISGDRDVGGLVGFLESGTNMDNITVSGSISARILTGSVGGGTNVYNTSDTLSNIHSSAAISATGSTVGGLFGELYMVLSNSSFSGTVSSVSESGGLVGLFGGKMERSFFTGTVSATSSTGGLVGYLDYGTITDSYASGDVSGTSTVGGLVGNGDSGTITNSYATGTVTGTGNVGGFAGYSNLTITNGYWNTEQSGQSVGIGIDDNSQSVTGLSSSQMHIQSNFTGFDFTNTWNIFEGISQPYLQAIAPDTVNGVVLAEYTTVPGGSGTEIDPYQISSLPNLYWLSQNSSFWEDEFIQTVDIDASETTNWANGAGFSPIGSSSTRFKGTYNGNGHSITGLTINRPSTDYIGFFGFIDSASIDKVSLSSLTISGNQYVGGLLGLSFNESFITQSTTTGTVTGASDYVGGLAGSFISFSDSLGSFSNNSSTATVTGASQIGGLVGFMNINGTIQNSDATGDVNGLNEVGGFIGQVSPYNTVIKNSYATGNVISSGAGVIASTGVGVAGGLVGALDSGEIIESYATGNVSGLERVGGLVGRSLNDITNSYATGSVSGNEEVGGLVGFFSNQEVINSYSTGTVEGNTSAGGLIGLNQAGIFTNSYWNSVTSKQASGIGTDDNSQTVNDLSIGEMIDSTNFTNWDFSSVWNIDQGFGYPYLRDLSDYRMVVATVDSGEGWRMLGNPGDVTYDELLNPVFTQGYEGSDGGTGFGSNVFFYEEGTQTWTAPSKASDYFGKADSNSVNTSLNGVLLYVYGDDDGDGNEDSWPKYLVSENTSLNESFDISLGYTDNVSEDSVGWNLISNPYPVSLDWTEVVTNNDITNTFPVAYIWDDSLNAGAGAYRINYGYPLPPGLPQDLIFDGPIPAMQAFWVKATETGASLSFKSEYQTNSEKLYKQVKQTELGKADWMSLKVEKGVYTDQLILFEAENYNVPKLQTIASKNVQLMATIDDQNWVSRSLIEGEQELPLHITTTESGAFTLSWSASEEFFINNSITLVDAVRGTSIQVNNHETYQFEISEPHATRFKLIVNSNSSVSNENGSDLPTVVALDQNYPNPFNPSTNIRFELPQSGNVELLVFNILGRKVATLVDQRMESGYHQIRFNARDLASGIYLYQLRTSEATITKKLTLIK
ncbi:MAG: hypothetical protein BalsKO_21320 [Balneolaceae bacterium]